MDDDQSSARFDAEALLAALEASTREQELIAAERPSREQLSESIGKLATLLYKWGDISRRLAALLADRDPERTYAWFPHADSLAQHDFDHWQGQVIEFCATNAPDSPLWLETSPVRNPTAWGIDFVVRCFHTIVDNLAAVGELVRLGEHVRAPIILSRTVLEAAATACHIIDPGVDHRERGRRIMNLHFAELQESWNEALASKQSGEDEERELSELILFAESVGYTPKIRKPSWQSPYIPSSGGGQSDSARIVIDQILPGGVGLSMWRSLSAVAHSREAHTLLPDEYSLPHEVKAWQRTKSVAWHTVAPLMVVRELCVRLETFLGWEFAEWSETVQVLNFQWSVAAGLHDDAIRKRLNLDEA